MRYYFHIHNDLEVLDEEGLVLPDFAAAKLVGLAEARNLAMESIRDHGHLVLHHRIEIVDETGTRLETIRFGDVVEVRD